MIYTLTLNPAIDHIIRLEKLEIGETNRMISDTYAPGGKGINVSLLLKNLGHESIALGYIAGFTGKELECILKNENIKTDFIHAKEGSTRINVKIKAKQETEINGQGLNLSQEEINELFTKLERINDGDLLFLAGSIPKTLGTDFYMKIMNKLSDKDVIIVVDATGKELTDTLKFNPYLIKPNRRELEQIFDTEINSIEEIEIYARKLKDMGAKNVIISLGSKGALYVSESGESYHLDAPKGEVIDTVGSGDSMVAAFLYAKMNKFNDSDAFKYSVSAGSATAFSKKLATKEEIENIYKNL